MYQSDTWIFCLKRDSAIELEDIPGGKVDVGEAFGDVGVVDAVFVEGPAGGRLNRPAAEVQGFEPGEVHPPGVSILWRE